MKLVVHQLQVPHGVQRSTIMKDDIEVSEIEVHMLVFYLNQYTDINFKNKCLSL